MVADPAAAMPPPATVVPRLPHPSGPTDVHAPAADAPATPVPSGPHMPAEAARLIAADPSLLRLVVQPIINTLTGETAGYEALSRCPDAWKVRPDQLFEAAEADGLSVDLSLSVLSRALELRDELPPRRFLTVNCSPHDLASPRVRACLAISDLSKIVLELTETAWPSDESAVLETVEIARARGALIAADDVGSGYAGLLQLVRLRPALVKVDRGLVERVETDPAAVAVIRMLGELAGQMDAWLLVEGVETYEQVLAMTHLGVPLLQGYYLGRPAAPWPDTEHTEEVARLGLTRVLDEHLVAYQRPARPGELTLDDNGRPLHLMVARAHAPALVTTPLCLAASTGLDEAIARAISRPDPVERIAAMVVTNDTGQATGVVELESLIRARLSL